MKIAKLLLLTSVISLNTVFAQESRVSDKAKTETIANLELPKIKVVPIKDTKHNRQYELYIKLPEGYSENVYVNYPVLYFTDALWHIEILSGSADFLMKNAILVGISWEKDLKGELATIGAHASRFRDFSIQPLSNPEAQSRYQFGQAGNHLDFIRNDVIKYVENNYRTVPGNRSYFGYSAGGKFGAYTLLTQPSTFKNYILGSPSLSSGRDVPVLSKLVANEALNANVFISYGDLEKETSPHTDEIIAMLKNKNDERFLLKHEVIEGTHETAFPMTAVRSMKWLSQLLSPVTNYPLLEGSYLGQKLPGLTPEVFAPGIVSKGHRDWTGRFTPDMKEYYFTRNNSKDRTNTKIAFKSENNRWHETVLEPNMGGSISPDGKTMHSGNKYRERTDNGWSELKSLGSPFEDIPIMVLTASTNGTYVFDEQTEVGTIRYSRLIDGKRETPKAFGKEINSGKWTAHPFIASDESYIIWDSEREEGYGDNDLYISFRQPDGSWSAAINLGDKINTEGPDTGGVVSPDGKYFFFNRKINSEDSDVYWVNTQIFESLRPKG